MRKLVFIFVLFFAAICLADSNLAAWWKMDTIAYTVSGTITPDATGVYNMSGLYNTVHYYKRTDNAYYIWLGENEGWYSWTLSTALGEPGDAFWTGQEGSDYTKIYPTGFYSPHGTATGILTFLSVIDEKGDTNNIFITDSCDLSQILVTGKCGNGFAFDKTKHEQINPHKTFQEVFFNHESFTVIWWLNPNDGQPGGYASEDIFSLIDQDCNSQIVIAHSPIGKIQFSYQSGDSNDNSCYLEHPVFSDGGNQPWTMVAGIFKKTGPSSFIAYLYVNGVLVGQYYPIDTVVQNSSAFPRIGASNLFDGEGYLSGFLDEGRVYKIAISPVQIRILWRQTNTGLSLDWLPVRRTKLIRMG